MRSPVVSLLVAAFALALLAACGTRGALTLPPKPQANPHSTATPADNNSSTATEAAR